MIRLYRHGNMKKVFLSLLVLLCISLPGLSQTDSVADTTLQIRKFAISVYPVSNKIGLRYFFTKNTGLELRGSYDNFLSNNITVSSQLRVISRLQFHERTNLYAGLGTRADIIEDEGQKTLIWIEVPLGVELFPFPKLTRLTLLIETDLVILLTNNAEEKLDLSVTFGVGYCF